MRRLHGFDHGVKDIACHTTNGKSATVMSNLETLYSTMNPYDTCAKYSKYRHTINETKCHAYGHNSEANWERKYSARKICRPSPVATVREVVARERRMERKGGGGRNAVSDTAISWLTCRRLSASVILLPPLTANISP